MAESRSLSILAIVVIFVTFIILWYWDTNYNKSYFSLLMTGQDPLAVTINIDLTGQKLYEYDFLPKDDKDDKDKDKPLYSELDLIRLSLLVEQCRERNAELSNECSRIERQSQWIEDSNNALTGANLSCINEVNVKLSR